MTHGKYPAVFVLWLMAVITRPPPRLLRDISHRNGLIFYLEPKWLTPYFGSIGAPLKKCCQSRCQLGYPKHEVMRLRQPGMQAPEAVPRFGGPAVPTALVPMVTWLEWRMWAENQQTFCDFTLNPGRWMGILIWRIIINPYMTETYNQYNSLHKPNQPGFLSPVGPQIVVSCYVPSSTTRNSLNT